MTKKSNWMKPERGVMFLKTLALSYSSFLLFSFTSTCQTASWLYYLWMMFLVEISLGLVSELITRTQKFIKNFILIIQVLEFIWQLIGIYLTISSTCQDEMQNGIRILLCCFGLSTLILFIGMVRALFN
ncbi:unnamed protein product [Blepharisma stoltei]|uniref:Uncharacterized protein n=1 Tax=Blepharisma stoltei TaxID=1481888 RepID=A0AAU9JXY0_9CILI|nr:unnamed protein product [Blepharisma stoltei]